MLLIEDYSIEEMEDEFFVERKSPSGQVCCFAAGRVVFIQKPRRLGEIPNASARKRALQNQRFLSISQQPLILPTPARPNAE